MKPKNLKTLLLGLAIIIITFSLFVGLPELIPSFKNYSCERIIWGCTQRGVVPVDYITTLWNRRTPPDITKRENWLFGRIAVVNQTGSDSIKIASGYLLYATAPPKEAFNPAPIFMGGLENRLITVMIFSYYEGETETETINTTTGENGFFTFTFAIDNNVICYRVVGMYHGEIITPQSIHAPVQIYHPGEGHFSTCPPDLEKELTTSYWWVFLIAGLALVLFGIAAFWYLRRRSRMVQAYREQPAEQLVSEKRTAQPEESTETGGTTGQVEINFAGIEADLPDVWGINDYLEARISLKDRKGFVLALQSFDIDWASGETTAATTGNEGEYSERHVYASKGDYLVTAGYQESSGNNVSSWRKIQIVDYREEMVKLFGEMLKSLDMEEIVIEPDMTPREVERLLADNLEEVSRETIRRVIDGFEEANYSTHPVNRNSYVRMYRAIREIINYE